MKSIEYIRQTSNDKHLWLVNNSQYIVTSFSNMVSTNEILAFISDSEGNIQWNRHGLELAGLRNLSNTLEDHTLIAYDTAARLYESNSNIEL
jgi:hypothetical protein